MNEEDLIAELMKYGQEIPSQEAIKQLAKASGRQVSEIEDLYASIIQGAGRVEDANFDDW